MSETTATVDLGKSRCRLVVHGATAGERSGIGAPGLAAAGGVEAALTAILRCSTVSSASTRSAWGGRRLVRPGGGRGTRRRARRTDRSARGRGVGRGHRPCGRSRRRGRRAAHRRHRSRGAGRRPFRCASGRRLGSRAGRLRQRILARPRGVARRAPCPRRAGRAHRSHRGARRPVGPPSAVQAWLAADGALARRLATLAPLVLAAAADDDPVARGIVDEAVRLLAATTAAAAGPTADVALHGGLTDHDGFRAALARALEGNGRRVLPARGGAMDGALLLTRRLDLPMKGSCTVPNDPV